MYIFIKIMIILMNMYQQKEQLVLRMLLLGIQVEKKDKMGKEDKLEVEALEEHIVTMLQELEQKVLLIQEELVGGATAGRGGATSGEANGAQGGRGSAGNSNGYEKAGGGAGNPGGLGGTGAYANSYDCKGENGTGGLLIIYADKIQNLGEITSNGKSGGTGWSGGGSSGGGSVNVFYNTEINDQWKITANGGEPAYGSDSRGGAGGKGTISIGSISTGRYLSDIAGKLILKEEQIELVRILNDEEVIGNGG